MQIRTLYSRNLENVIGVNQYNSVLEYYIVERSIGEGYCELKSYGIQIKRISMYDGGGKNEESKLINDIFFDRVDAEKFIKMLSDNLVTPASLKDVIDEYVDMTIAMRQGSRTA